MLSSTKRRFAAAATARERRFLRVGIKFVFVTAETGIHYNTCRPYRDAGRGARSRPSAPGRPTCGLPIPRALCARVQHNTSYNKARLLFSYVLFSSDGPRVPRYEYRVSREHGSRTRRDVSRVGGRVLFLFFFHDSRRAVQNKYGIEHSSGHENTLVRRIKHALGHTPYNLRTIFV